jgi:hypothetical protein
VVGVITGRAPWVARAVAVEVRNGLAECGAVALGQTLSRAAGGSELDEHPLRASVVAAATMIAGARPATAQARLRRCDPCPPARPSARNAGSSLVTSEI